MSFRKSVSKASLMCGLALPMLLAACATEVADPLAAPLTGNQSAVVISITSNTYQLETFDSVRLRPVGSEKEYLLKKAKKLVSRDTSLFTGVLPVGEYQFVKLEDNSSHHHLKLTSGSGFIGNFRVMGGAPVDLGRLIITPMNSDVLVGRSRRVISNFPLIKGYAPEYVPLYEKETAGGWVEPRSASDSVEDYAITKPGDLDCITEKDDKTILASGRMGTLMVRLKQGEWRPLNSTSIAALNCALPVNLPNADILIPGEFGTLLRHAKGESKLHHVSTGDLPFGNLVRILGNSTNGWYIANQEGDYVGLYHSPVLENGKWTQLRKDPANWWVRERGLYNLWPTANGLAYTVGREVIRSLDFGTGQWSEIPLPEKGSDSTVTISPTGMWAIRAGRDKNYVSYDEGKRWELVKTKLRNVYNDIGPIQQMNDGSLMVQAGNAGHVFRSLDKGQTWESGTNESRSSYRVYALKSVPLLRVQNAGYFGLMSMDSSLSGHNWYSEYDSFDLKIYEMQKKRGLR